MASRWSVPFALAVLGAASVPAQSDDLVARVNRALDEARPALLAHLREANLGRSRVGELALLLLAAVHDGVPATDPVVAAAVRVLAKAEPTETYDLALRLLVLEAMAEFPDRAALAKRDCRRLLRNRDDSGAFSYSEGAVRWDLSNTQYAALGLRAAKALGAPIERSVWTRLAKEVGDQQDSYGGFGYARGPGGEGNRKGDRGVDWRGDSYASMTAAGIAVIAICRQALGEDEQGTPLHKLLVRGWQWFDRNVAAIGSADERWSYYFHYGLERAAILCDVEKVAGQDWYARGAGMFVRDQLPGGGWRSATDGGGGIVGAAQRGRGQPVATAFAVLFLRRKFQKVAGPITPRPVEITAVGPDSGDADVDTCAAELVRRGKAALPEVLHALRSEILPRRRAAAKALLGIAGESFGYDPARDPEQNREAIKKAELWHLRNR